MSGHSKWATIKRKKAATDEKRGKIFSKLIREITVAARAGGGDLNANPRLRTAVLKAKENNMPSDNIERAIKKGTGETAGVSYDEIRYEAYGPGGVAIMVDCLTDNKNRTTPEIKTIFNKNGGSLGETGCVAYIFDRKGMIVVDSGGKTEDQIIELLLDFDVEDVKQEEDSFVIVTAPEAINNVYDTLKENKLNISLNEVTYIPKTTTTLDEKNAHKCLKIIELLEEQDDVQHVYSNYDIPDDLMMKISEEE